MARVSTYLNFEGETEEAFRRYAEIFGTEITEPITRMGELPPDPSRPPLGDNERDLIMHMRVTILGGHVLMGTDMLASMGHSRRIGNNVTLNLEVDSEEEARRLYDALSEGGSESSGLQPMPWGIWGVTLDRFGIRWMFNVASA
jgi:PhnB protein